MNETTLPLGPVQIRCYEDAKGNRSVSGEDYSAWIGAGWTAGPGEYQALEGFMLERLDDVQRRRV